MARPVIGAVALVLLLPLVQAATTPDPAGDVAERPFGEPVDQPAVDIIEVRGTFDDGLSLTIQVAGLVPVDGASDPDRRFTYFFMAARGEGATLSQSRDVAAACHFHQGQRDLQCTVTEGDATLRRTAAADRNVSIVVDVPWDGPLTVGAITHESLPNGTRRDIVAQDFTDNAVPYQPAPTEPVTEPTPTPWWRTPWILVALVVVAAAGAWWAKRGRT